MKQLNVIVPGLLGPFSSELPAHIHSQLSQAIFKPLRTWLSRAQVLSTSADNYYATLCAQIAPQYSSGLCRLTAQLDQINISSGHFYRADPVHFKAESDHAILLGAELIEPDMQESLQLIETFNQHFEEDKLSLHASSAQRWYLQSETALELEFSALDYSLGRDIKHFLPKGKDELWWRKTVNEAQMLFFQHEVNQRRESKGQLSINGLWLWDVFAAGINNGQDHNTGKNIQLFADDVVALSLAKQSTAKVKLVRAFSAKSDMSENNILVLDQLYPAVCYGDIDAWFDLLKEFNQNVFQDILRSLQLKQVDEVLIYPCDGRVFKLDRGKLRSFWRATKNLAQFIDSAD